MIPYPDINPVAFHVGSFPIFWYGLMYLFSLLTCWGILALRIKQSSFVYSFTREELSDIVFYAALGVIIGGRLGYMLFYAWPNFIIHPGLFFKVWEGGMSFHGGLLGVILALGCYAYKIKQPLINLTDFIAPVVPLGLAAGRIGNFINGELWGRVTTVPWAMIFPQGGPLPRHPSQLYEFLLEGVVLFFIVWVYSRKKRPPGAISGLFLLCYGLFRFFIEFFREPDAQIGFVAFGWVSKGQLLSFPMIVVGMGMLMRVYRGKKTCDNI
ncbi:MAG: lgt [Gammaproteobacteria bacterium]|jgi:phosphatidylglycerol:prolipoprotein diacylglycerol transferase|nr:lgt [Gammaproteobacteria bacterium]